MDSAMSAVGGQHRIWTSGACLANVAAHRRITKGLATSSTDDRREPCRRRTSSPFTTFSSVFRASHSVTTLLGGTPLRTK